MKVWAVVIKEIVDNTDENSLSIDTYDDYDIGIFSTKEKADLFIEDCQGEFVVYESVEIDNPTSFKYWKTKPSLLKNISRLLCKFFLNL